MQYEIIKIDDKELKELKNLSEFSIENIEIENDEQYKNLCELLKKVKGKTKEVKEFFKDPKSQAYENHKSISRLEKEMLDKLVKFEDMAKKEIGEYVLNKEKNKTLDNPLDAPKVQGVSTSSVYKWEVEDINKVPKAIGTIPLWQLNEKTINNLVKTTNGTVKIEGIRIYEEKSVRVRGE